MARFENFTVDELDALRIVLSGSDQKVSDDMRAFLLGQVEQQLDVKQDNEKLRADAAEEADTSEKQQENPLSR